MESGLEGEIMITLGPSTPRDRHRHRSQDGFAQLHPKKAGELINWSDGELTVFTAYDGKGVAEF